ncbi:MAG: right-handed parallel beta-helix repeat-containing protein [bacterium]|nr:right-handed parallel beta-helix repeat-containing protein [bacterium]
MRTLLLLSALVCAAPAAGAVLRVERDGHGDYSSIQLAVDAAASGDTILIGPGRYNEGAIWTTPGWTAFVRVVVRQAELTLIGAGPELTIIGPTTTWDLTQGWNRGIDAGTYWGNRRVFVSGIGFENMGYGVTCAEAPDAAVFTNCSFRANANSMLCAFGGSLEVRNCSFDQVHRNYQHIEAIGLSSVLISDCDFSLATVNNWSQYGVHIQGVPSAVVTDCRFLGGFSGLALLGVDAATVSNCVFSRQTAGRVDVSNGMIIGYSTANLTDCTFDSQVNAVWASERPDIRMERVSILDATVASLNFDSMNSLVVHESLLARGAQYTILQNYPCDERSQGEGLPHLDLTNNDWGTSSADSIASWIRTCDYIVDYVPFIGQPVAVENRSWGDLKALFR